MYSWVSRRLGRTYERLLHREIGDGPTHVAIIQDGNRRYARKQGADAPDGHRAGAETSEQVLDWCDDVDIKELTLYTFSTENFDRPAEQNEPLFDMIASKLQELADSDRLHDREVCIRAIGEIDRLPERVKDAIDYAEAETDGYDEFRLNIALAYGGRNELLRATREVTAAVDAGDLTPEEIDVETIEQRLYRQPVRDVDLIIRTGGDERTSNFLPWHANGNEAAVYFCAPYWPEFSKIDFLRGIRTYESREQSWQRTKVDRSIALVRALASAELSTARRVVARLRDQLPRSAIETLDDELDSHRPSEEADTEPRAESTTEPAD